MKLQLLNNYDSSPSERFYSSLDYIARQEIPFEDFMLEKGIVYDIKVLLAVGELDKIF